jgi:RNA polymerase sigma-70 factor (ECF subfamily)
MGDNVTKMESLRSTLGRETLARDTRPVAGPEEQVVHGLVERAARGEAEAFGEIYSIYLDRIYRYVFYQVKNRTVAEDLTEEIFMKAWGAIRKFNFKGRPFSAWLYRIAHNHVIDYFRTNHQSQFLDEVILADDSEPAKELEGKQIRRMLMDAISELSEQQRQIILLKFVEGIDNQEIEQVTGKRQGAIRVMQMRALAALREKLSEEMGECELSYQRR